MDSAVLLGLRVEQPAHLCPMQNPCEKSESHSPSVQRRNKSKISSGNYVLFDVHSLMPALYLKAVTSQSRFYSTIQMIKSNLVSYHLQLQILFL